MQGFNMGRYYAPDMDPRKERWNKRHPLGARARKLVPAPGQAGQGSLVVRFEMPFDGTCTSCHASIPQGRRFNADKSPAGQYLSTPIWRFEASCPSCSARFAIQTDPEHTRYKTMDGVTERVKEWDDEWAGTWSHEFRDDMAPKEEDPFAVREKTRGMEQTRREGEERTASLRDDRDKFWSDPATQNAKLRAQLRAEKRRAFATQRADDHLRARIAWNDDRKLLPPPPTKETQQLWRQAQRDHPAPRPRPSSSSLPSSSRLSSSSSAARRLAAKLTANTNTRRRGR